jgi:hypothetical protein
MIPTPEQSEIIAASRTDSSLMINALAGTGKTTTLTLLASEIKGPALALAFNVKIKKELEKRFPPNFTVMTINGLGHRAWSFAINKKQMMLNDRKLGELTTEALKPFPDSKSKWSDIRQLAIYAMQRGLVPSRYEHAKGLIPDTPEVWEEISEENFLDLTHDERKLSRAILCSSIEEGFKGHISFDDQIYLPTFFNGAFPRFATVLVDEAQDLSAINHLMLKRCAAGRLIVVGDPRQAIYAFRGADSQSMSNLRKLRSSWIDLPLNTTFRCPKAVVARQWGHAPDYRAAETNPAGQILDLTGGPWKWADLPVKGELAVLCRNNAPLLSLAFKLIRKGVSVAMLGREIGKGLVSIVKKVCPEGATPIPEFAKQLEEWRESQYQIFTANGKDAQAAGVNDRAECIQAVMEGANPKDVQGLIQALESLFAKDVGRVTLASGHKSKGLEWETVVHLDPWRIPSGHAKKALSEGDPRPMEQEQNLRYVIETRTKHTLVLADLKGLE